MSALRIRYVVLPEHGAAIARQTGLVERARLSGLVVHEVPGTLEVAAPPRRGRW